MKSTFALCTGSLLFLALFSAQSFAGQQSQMTYTPTLTQNLGTSNTIAVGSQNGIEIIDPNDDDGTSKTNPKKKPKPKPKK